MALAFVCLVVSWSLSCFGRCLWLFFVLLFVARQARKGWWKVNNKKRQTRLSQLALQHGTQHNRRKQATAAAANRQQATRQAAMKEGMGPCTAPRVPQARSFLRARASHSLRLHFMDQTRHKSQRGAALQRKLSVTSSTLTCCFVTELANDTRSCPLFLGQDMSGAATARARLKPPRHWHHYLRTACCQTLQLALMLPAVHSKKHRTSGRQHSTTWLPAKPRNPPSTRRRALTLPMLPDSGHCRRSGGRAGKPSSLVAMKQARHMT